ncbi:MAG: penicillin-binding protein 2 [Paludibacteraceae bacterium]|nr:penicillin-binding protein 2 [Paludibacteraceae bacterium]
MINDRYHSRSLVLRGIVIAVASLLVLRLFYLQVIDRSKVDKADRNALYRQTIYPSRGLIYDRNGKLLVFNQAVYDVMLTFKEMGQDFDTLGFCNVMSITRQDFESRLSEISDRNRNRGFSKLTPQVFMSLLSKEDVSVLQESLFSFPGVAIRERTVRDYTYQSAAHVLGNVGEVNQNDLDRDPYYARGDYSGRDGIERCYEKILRGEKGVEVLMRDARGRIKGSYHNGELDQQPKSGTDILLTLDIRIQMLVEQLLDGKKGSAVAIEPKTGEILALVSSPAWDPKQLVGRPRSKNYNTLLNDKHKPLLNRAIQAQYPPGSTFKLIQSLVGLQAGVLNEHTMYPCSGKESTPIKCTHHHGSPVDLESAIEQSCNPYYWQAFRDILQAGGNSNRQLHRNYDTWRERVLSFGFGSAFDTDIRNQYKGSIPASKMYDRIYGKSGWKAITIRSLSIGQGEILVTPLQLANEAACIANGGYYVTPHLARLGKAELDSAGVPQNQNEKHYTLVDARHFDVVKRGMARVMTNGTGRHYAVPELNMCGKTGTVQNPHGRDHAIFIGFAPLEDPKIAVAVVVENAGFGATWAAPIATMMMEMYLTDTVARTDLFNRIQSAQLID